MAWETVEVTVNGSSLSASMKAGDGVIEWAIPFSSGLEEGGGFECGGKSYTAITCEDVAQRGEVLLITTQGVKNDKSKARRAKDSAGREDPDGQSDA